MKTFMTYIIILITACFVYPQVENADKFSTKVNFYQDFLNFNTNEEGKTRLDVFVQVPYTEVQFVKTPQGFEAQYSVTVSVFTPDKDKIVIEKIWSEKLREADFQQTVSKNNFHLSLKSFSLAPGNYLIRTSVEDKDSKNNYVYENLVKVRDINDDPGLSDIMLIAKQTQTETGNKILPNVSKNVYAQKSGLPIFYEIYSDKEQNVKVQYSITDKEKNTVFSETNDRKLNIGRNQVFFTLGSAELSLGDYRVTVLLKDENDKNLNSVSKEFSSRWLGLPSTVKDLDKAIDQLIYIASSSEIEFIEDGETKDVKMERYKEFWEKKDPTPNTEENQVFDEYYRRITYANENFSHYIEGWRTDRGMVYIILGSPNNVERHPFEYDSKPYEVWEYYELNKSFVFLDETGFGDYRLITPLYGDFYRYR